MMYLNGYNVCKIGQDYIQWAWNYFKENKNIKKVRRMAIACGYENAVR